MISLLITTPGRSTLLHRSLDRLKELSLPGQLVVVDDGGDEGLTLEYLVKAFEDTTGTPSVYVRNPTSNGNCALPRNMGLAVCDQPVVAFACPECYFVSDVIAQLADRDPGVLTLAGVVYYGTGEDDRHRIGELELSGDGKANAPYVASVGREHLVKIGGWDERFTGWGTEDLDLMARLGEIGVDRDWDMSAEVLHQFHGDGGGPEVKGAQAKANSSILDRKPFTHEAPFHVCSDECLVSLGVKIPRQPGFFGE